MYIKRCHNNSDYITLCVWLWSNITGWHHSFYKSIHPTIWHFHNQSHLVAAQFNVYSRVHTCRIIVQLIVMSHQLRWCPILSIQIDYRQPGPTHQEAAYHIMPLLGSNMLATLSFLDAIGARQFTWFQEHVKEFSEYPLPQQGLPDWVSIHLSACCTEHSVCLIDSCKSICSMHNSNIE